MIEITDNRGLKELGQKLANLDFFTLDTEFIREKTYYPILALVQVSWHGQGPILIDPLEISDWSPFHDALLNPSICKVFHAGRQDLEIFHHQMQAMPQNLFDTQIVASMCGYGEQIGYSGLVAKVLGVHLTKGNSYSNWLQRPLTAAQLNYARDDVKYLPELYERLSAVAQTKSRTQWIRQETGAQLNESLFNPNPDQLWTKVKKAGTLKSKNAAVLRELAKWRDATARAANRPIRFILSDEVLIELSKIEKLTLEQLISRRGLQGRFVDRYGQTLLDLHAKARALPKTEWPFFGNPRRKPPSGRIEILADLAWLLIKEIAREADIAPTHLISKKDLPYFVEAYTQNEDLSPFSLSQGWRKEMVGELLFRLLEGRLLLQVKNHRLVWQEQA